MYTTESEMKFLDGLGSYKHDNNLPRYKLLRYYYKASKKRKDWGKINPEVLRARIRAELGWEKKS